MKRTCFSAALACILLTLVANARTWTDTAGKTLEAEFVKMDGANVVLKIKGKDVPVPLTRLSQADQDFLKNQPATPTPPPPTAPPPPAAPAAPKALTLCGKPLQLGGQTTIVEEPLTPATLKGFSKAQTKPTTLKIAIALPANFDPELPQRIMWTSAPINNDGERTRGNIGGMGGWVKPAIELGWAVIAVDTEHGNPRLEDNQNTTGDFEAHKQAVAALAAVWPKSKSWQYACCGFSGGAKATFYRAADLAACDLNVIGMFLGGCNQDMTNQALAETKCSKSDLRKAKVWISNGKDDKVSTVGHAQALQTSTKSFYRKVRLELYDGGHGNNGDEFKKAMTWFLEDQKTKP